MNKILPLFLFIAIFVIVYLTNQQINYQQFINKVTDNDLINVIKNNDIVNKIMNNQDNQDNKNHTIYQSLWEPTENETKYKQFMEHDRFYNKVERLHLPDNSQKYNNKSIKDIYDDLVRNDSKLYSKKCLKNPYVDPYSKKNVYVNGKNISNNHWEYKDECFMNGGEDNGLTGFDPGQSINQAI